MPRHEEAGAREALLRTGLKLFAEKGLNGVSVRELASAAKVNLSLVSYYFGGKEGLYSAIMSEHVLQVRNQLQQILHPQQEKKVTKESFEQTLLSIIRTIVFSRAQSAEISILMQRERLNGLPYCREIYEEIMEPLAQSLVSFMEAAKKAHVVRAEISSRTFFLSLTESIFGYFILHDCRLVIWKDAYRFPDDMDQYCIFLAQLFSKGALR